MGATFWYFGEESSLISLNSRPLFLLKQPAVGLLKAAWWCRRRGEGEELIATGGISMESSCGGGCCHCGRGPARRRVCRSGPASITAFNNLPFSGNGLSAAKFKASGGNSDETGFAIGDKFMFWFLKKSLGVDSFSMLDVRESTRAAASCCCCCCFWSFSCSKRFSSISFWHCVCASFLSLMDLFSTSLRWMSSISRLSISSLADKIVASSSQVLYKRLNSSIPCHKNGKFRTPFTWKVEKEEKWGQH